MIGREIREAKTELGWAEKIAWKLTMLRIIMMETIALVITPAAYAGLAWAMYYIAERAGLL